MLIKINLLPRTINEKAALRNLAILMAALVLLVAGGGFAYSTLVLKPELEYQEDLAARTEQWKQRVDGINSQKDALIASIKPFEDKIKFINDVLEYNKAYPRLYREVVRWTYGRVVYSSMKSDGSSVSMNAWCKNLDDLGRYLLNMYRAQSVFSQVAISDIPGYPEILTQTGTGGPSQPQMGGIVEQGGGSQAGLTGIRAIESGVERVPPKAEGINFSVTCKLVKPIVAPAFAGAAGQTQQ